MTRSVAPAAAFDDSLPFHLLVGGLLAALLPACSGGADPGLPAGPSAACVLSVAPDPDAPFSQPGGSSAPPPIFGLTDPVDPGNAPVPSNFDEALLFGMLYEPLVRMDCTGRLLPGLVEAWDGSEDGRRWTFTLRPNARFWNGDSLTARDVSESWRRSQAAGRAPWEPARPLSVEVLDDRRLRVTFTRSWARPPPAMAAAALAVTRPAEGAGWPRVGTGPYRPADPGTPIGRDGRDDDLVLEPVPPAAPDPAPSVEATDADGLPGPLLPRVRVRLRAGADPRDLLDEGVDVVFAGDPGTLEYAALRSDLATRPLPWSRRYVLVRASVPGSPGPDSLPSDAFLEGLARDVALEEARAATGPGCTMGSVPLPRSSEDGTRIGYPGGDPTARALAERIVALASGSRSPNGGSREALGALGLVDPPASLVAVPVEADAGRFLDAGEAARILGLPRRPDLACPGPEGSSTLQSNPRVVPLVDTRRRIVSRYDVLVLVVDGSGTPLPVSPGPSGATAERAP